MPLFMDIHIIETDEFFVEEVVKAHMKDLRVQERYGVIQKKYWVDVENKKVFCLMEGPSKEACNATHAEAHGMTACNIIEVSEDEYNLLLTGISKNDLAHTDTGQVDAGFKTLLLVNFMDFTGQYAHYPRELYQMIAHHKGHIVAQPDEEILALFNSAADAVVCAITISQLLNALPSHVEYKLAVVTGQLLGHDSKDLFEDIKLRIRWLNSAGATNIIYIDDTTKAMAMKAPDAPKINFKSYKIVTEQDFALLRQLFRVLDAELTNPDFSIDKLNRTLGLSKATSYRAITLLTGMSPSRLIQELRFRQALGMLRNHQKTVAEIAYDTGFSSPTYFTRAFKQRYGILPTAMR